MASTTTPRRACGIASILEARCERYHQIRNSQWCGMKPRATYPTSPTSHAAHLPTAGAAVLPLALPSVLLLGFFWSRGCMNTTNGGGSYDNGLPITLEGDEPLTTPNEAARTAVKAAPIGFWSPWP